MTGWQALLLTAGTKRWSEKTQLLLSHHNMKKNKWESILYNDVSFTGTPGNSFVTETKIKQLFRYHPIMLLL